MGVLTTRSSFSDLFMLVPVDVCRKAMIQLAYHEVLNFKISYLIK